MINWVRKTIVLGQTGPDGKIVFHGFVNLLMTYVRLSSIYLQVRQRHEAVRNDPGSKKECDYDSQCSGDGKLCCPYFWYPDGTASKRCYSPNDSKSYSFLDN